MVDPQDPGTDATVGRLAALRSSRPAMAGLLVVAVVVIAGLIAVGAGMFAPAGGAPRSSVASFEGSGTQTTDRFEVREGWQIRWSTEGTTFAFAIRGDVEMGTIIDRTGPGSGVTSPVPTGSFYLEVSAEGPWTIEVVQGN